MQCNNIQPKKVTRKQMANSMDLVLNSKLNAGDEVTVSFQINYPRLDGTDITCTKFDSDLGT